MWEDLRQLHALRRPEILAALKGYAAIPRSRWFYELCFCLLTPQSRALNAGDVVDRLEEADFLGAGGNPTALLRHPDHYIRFHNVKAARLLALRDQWRQVDQALTVANSAPEARLWLVENVSGLGMKEASHFLRNVGHRGLAILDRHILRCLVGEGALAEVPEVGGKRKYLEVEHTFKAFADYVGIDSDELDLLFWSKFTGRVFK